MAAYDLMLQPRPGFYPGVLHFQWDPSTGELGQAAADALADLLLEQEAYGYLSVEPYPSSIPFTDPWRSLPQMAAFLSYHFLLPPELAVHLPGVSAGADPDAVQ